MKREGGSAVSRVGREGVHVKLLIRRGCKGEMFGKRRKGELEGEKGRGERGA